MTRNAKADDAVLLLLVTLPGEAAVHRACVEKLAMTDAQAATAIADARRRLTAAAEFHRDEELGRAIQRLHACYAAAIGQPDLKTALSAQKEINKLLDLYRPPETSSDESEEDARAELAQVREYLEPLKLAKAGTPVSELARLAVQWIVEHAD